MAGATLNIEVNASVNEAIRSLHDLGDSFDKLAKHVNRDAAGALGVFGVSLTALSNPLTAIAGGIKSSIGFTTQWADEMDKMARNTGMSTEAASKMAVIFGDFGIEAGQTTMAIKTLNKEGLSLNIETLKRLSAEYQAIKSPVEQLAFATKHFGRAAQDMTEILSKTPAEFDALSKAAERSGKIMSGEAVEAAQAFKLELAQLGDQLDGVKISVGGPLIGGLTKAITAWDQLTQSIKLGRIQIAAINGLITWESAALQAQVIVNGQVDTAMQEGNETRFTAIAALQRYVPLLVSEAGAYGNLYEQVQKQTKYTEEHELKAVADLEAAHGRLMEMLSGPVGHAEDDYYAQQKATGAQIAEVTAELDKLRASNGQLVTTVTDASVSQDEYNLAIGRAALAQQKYAEYSGTSTTAQESLRLAALSAQVSVDKMTEKLGGSTTGFVNNNKAIAENEAKLDELNGVYDDNAKAHEAATARVLFGYLEQSLAADGLSAVELGFLGKVGLAWGVLDQKTGAAMTNMSNALLTAGGDANTFLGIMGGIYALPHDQDFNLNVHINGAPVGDELFGGWTAPAGGGGGTAPPVDTFVPPGGMNATGADFIVPPGYPHDSYMMAVQSGEHVSVTPAGQPDRGGRGRGTTYNFNFNNAQPVTVPTALQSARAVAGAWG